MQSQPAHVIPKAYKPLLGLLDTQLAITVIKDAFQQQLRERLNLTRVSAPLFVRQSTGLNDDLNGVERKVSFDTIEEPGRTIEVVQSLAKWKRLALYRYDIQPGAGIYADMNAIRRDEITDNLHSLYVDQWDWEAVITREQRTLEHLIQTANHIHAGIVAAQHALAERYDALQNGIYPKELACITTQQLEDRWPELSPEQREIEFARENKAALIMQIGCKLKSGEKHDGRAPDYDDWQLNADIIYYFDVLDIAVELSSMGIRVDEASLRSQLDEAGCPERAEMPFHSKLLAGELPLTMGGGVGQSRMSMLLLKKAHVGEVQCGVWPNGTVDRFKQNGVTLL